MYDVNNHEIIIHVLEKFFFNQITPMTHIQNTIIFYFTHEKKALLVLENKDLFFKFNFFLYRNNIPIQV